MIKSSLGAVALLTIAAILSGCSTLPRDGPSGRAVIQGAGAGATHGSYDIVELTLDRTAVLKATPATFDASLGSGELAASDIKIGPGDVLSVSIYEPSGNLFSSGAGGSTTARNAATVRSGSQALPPLTVDQNGAVSVPFAGTVRVAGLSTGDAAAAIRRALAGKVANPQVIVSVAENAYNTVIILGEIKEPGRVPLSTNANRVLDVIAAAGGPTRTPQDLEVSIQRDGQTFSAPMEAVTGRFGQNIRLARGDQLNLIYRPRRFSTFGALGAVSETEMPAGPFDLAAALSKVGGLDTNSADARSVLVFRFERPEVAAALGSNQPATSKGVPIVYRLNLEDAAGFFTAREFAIEPDDIIYVPRSGSAEVGKFFTLVQTLTRVIYDVSVTSTLNN